MQRGAVAPTLLNTYISELDRPEFSKIRQTIMGCIFIHNNGDILHRFTSEPLRHGVVFVSAVALSNDVPFLSSSMLLLQWGR